VTCEKLFCNCSECVWQFGATFLVFSGTFIFFVQDRRSTAQWSISNLLPWYSPKFDLNPNPSSHFYSNVTHRLSLGHVPQLFEHSISAQIFNPYSDFLDATRYLTSPRVYTSVPTRYPKDAGTSTAISSQCASSPLFRRLQASDYWSGFCCSMPKIPGVWPTDCTSSSFARICLRQISRRRVPPCFPLPPL
jgi:hypothetical protein